MEELKRKIMQNVVYLQGEIQQFISVPKALEIFGEYEARHHQKDGTSWWKICNQAMQKDLNKAIEANELYVKENAELKKQLRESGVKEKADLHYMCLKNDRIEAELVHLKERLKGTSDGTFWESKCKNSEQVNALLAQEIVALSEQLKMAQLRQEKARTFADGWDHACHEEMAKNSLLTAEIKRMQNRIDTLEHKCLEVREPYSKWHESCDTPSDDRWVLVINERLSKVPSIAYYDEGTECYLTADHVKNYPFEVTHWTEMPEFGGDDE